MFLINYKLLYSEKVRVRADLDDVRRFLVPLDDVLVLHARAPLPVVAALLGQDGGRDDQEAGGGDVDDLLHARLLVYFLACCSCEQLGCYRRHGVYHAAQNVHSAWARCWHFGSISFAFLSLTTAAFTAMR